MSKPDKIDTQGMTADGIKNSAMLKPNNYKTDPITGKVIYPPMPVIKKRILPKNESLYNELKELINEVLDERKGIKL
tara:strand:- start:326 stop:556 length:231 start_codon:yes stop_codon:yes gene_type:complete